jgi:hypothetical protein
LETAIPVALVADLRALQVASNANPTSNKKLRGRLAAEKMAGAGQAAGRSGDVAGVADTSHSGGQKYC